MLTWDTKWGKAAYVACLLVCGALGGLLFGFSHGIEIGLGVFGLIVVIVSGVSLIRMIRKGPLAPELRDDAASAPTQPDWLSLGEIEVRVDGTRKRYLARFATGTSLVDEMGREEHRIAATLKFLGLPEATVVKLDKDAEATGTRRKVVVIPALAMRDAARFRSS
jgi:hypothetical protein